MWKHIVAQFYFLVIIKFVSCCQCDLNRTDLTIEKRHLDEHSTTESSDNNTETAEIMDSSFDQTTTTLPQSTSTEANETTTESQEMESNTSFTMSEEDTIVDNIFELNENSSEIVEAMITGAETFFETNDLGKTDTNESATESWKNEKKMAKQAQNDLWKKCRQYKNGDSFDMKKMADVWQVVYYRLANKLKCFKLHIKPLRAKDQRRFARVYGNFNDTVMWSQVFLEITSGEKEHKGRRHFLQGTSAERGVMENVIIDEEHCKNTTYLTLHRESGDQWLVIGKLLMMRDCENGDYVVFAKVPVQPRKADIMSALKKFGLNNPNGTMACNIEKTWLKFEEGSFT